MTLDFIEDAADLLDEAEYSYVILIQPKHGQRACVKSEIDNWNTCDNGASTKEDILQLLDITVFSEGEDG